MMAQSINQRFVEWVGQQPRDRVYDFDNTRGCALYLFLKENLFPVSEAGVWSWEDTDGNDHDADIDGGKLYCRGGHTFGALADRLARKDA